MDITAIITTEIVCPECKRSWAWLGDQGQSIVVHGRCLVCLLITESHPEPEADAMVLAVMESREFYEGVCGRRVFPCIVQHQPGAACPRCRNRGWVLGYPPGAAPPS